MNTQPHGPSLPLSDAGKTAAGRGPILEISGLSKRFDSFEAVAPLDLSINSGEFVTLLGPSGCGKTTLLRMISGFEQATTGTIASEGQNLTRLRPERRPFNMVFQSYALFPHLNVYDNVAYGLRASNLDEATIADRVGEALDMVGLSAHRTDPTASLSGGMSQRVALVRAIVNQPRILLLDEPLAALDLQLRKKMQLELRSIQQKLGTTFILVTHDQEESLVMSDRIVVMKSGRVEQVGTPYQIYREPRTRFVAEFIGETSLVAAEILCRSDGCVEVRMAQGRTGRFACFSRQAVSAGGKGAVSLRPEALSIVPVEGADFRGRITSSVFLGSGSRLTVRAEPDLELLVMSPDAENLAVGDEVGIAIVPGAGVFIPDP